VNSPFAERLVTIQVRLDGPTEKAVRYAAEQMDVQVNQVKTRTDCCQLYGSRIFKVTEDSKPFGAMSQAELAS
jgi:hypothetical protein